MDILTAAQIAQINNINTNTIHMSLGTKLQEIINTLNDITTLVATIKVSDTIGVATTDGTGETL